MRSLSPSDLARNHSQDGRIPRGCLVTIGFIVVLTVMAGLAGAGWVRREVQPTTGTGPAHVRFAETVSFRAALLQLQEKGIVRNATAMDLYARFKGTRQAVRQGTYELKPGMEADDIFRALRSPMRRNVRIPEGWWIARVAKRLEEQDVCSAEEYIQLANSPAEFAAEVDFELPKTSLEGYLFPDTYDLPPLIGARETIKRQLRAFAEKAVPALKDQKDWNSLLTVASMVELEAAVDEERPTVAGVIANRIRARQRLEIDATVLYALQEWKNLGPGQVRKVKSPYNTYLNAGLPPGPIGSPGLASIEAAIKPEQHGYFFYVARPNRTHIFTATYPEHLAAIRTARAEWAKEKK